METIKGSGRSVEWNDIAQIWANYRPFRHKIYVHFMVLLMHEMECVTFLRGGTSMLLHEFFNITCYTSWPCQMWSQWHDTVMNSCLDLINGKRQARPYLQFEGRRKFGSISIYWLCAYLAINNSHRPTSASTSLCVMRVNHSLASPLTSFFWSFQNSFNNFCSPCLLLSRVCTIVKWYSSSQTIRPQLVLFL